MVHPLTSIALPDGTETRAIAPVIISASRATDIPAFYSEWLMNRLRAGYCVWHNPYNGNPQYISFKNLKVIVFWTKNPAPLIPHLKEIDDMGIRYYFQYTLNNYVHEGFEPGLPPLDDRIGTFARLSDMVGPGRVIWRYDPLILTPRLDVDTLGNRIYTISKKLCEKTDKLVFSFVDISAYPKLSSLKSEMREFSPEDMEDMGGHFEKLKGIWKEWGWDVEIATCGEKAGLERYGIAHNRCVDPDLIVRLFGDDKELYNYVRHGRLTSEDLDGNAELAGDSVKDKGQRFACGCMLSKDIGSYNTCGHFCRYCYANRYDDIVSTKKNMSNHNPEWESIIKT